MFLLRVQPEQSASSLTLATSGQHESEVAAVQLCPTLSMWEQKKGCTQMTWGKWNTMHCRILGLTYPTSGPFQVCRTFQKEDKEASIFVVGDCKGHFIKSFMSWWWRQVGCECILRCEPLGSVRGFQHPLAPLWFHRGSVRSCWTRRQFSSAICFLSICSPHTSQQDTQVRTTSALLGFPSCVRITDGMSPLFLLFLILSCFYRIDDSPSGCKPLYTNSLF